MIALAAFLLQTAYVPDSRAMIVAEVPPAVRRITDTQKVVTAVGGTFAGAYPAGFFACPPVVDLSWVNAALATMTCELTASPTTAGFVGRCKSLSVASIVAAGAGVEVHVVSLPPSNGC